MVGLDAGGGLLEEAAQGLPRADLHHRVHAIRFAACDALVSAVKERFGRLDILVNNAGIARDGLLMTAKEEDFTQTLDTNLKGAYFCTRAAAKVMLRQK